ncbi:MAG: hypothetical protein OHK0039_06970 [Bacteroidia bacterium]
MHLSTRILLLILAVIFVACKRSVDVEPPTMVLAASQPVAIADSVCGGWEPQVFHLSNGDTLQLIMIFRDNEALAQYKIDIHSNFDCHGHSGKTTDWAVLQIGELSGTEETLTRSLPVPAEVTAGDYHFQVQVLDAAGNDEPSAYIYAIQVRHRRDTLPPVVVLDQPAPGLTVQRGTELRFAGTVTDDYSLGEGGNGLLRLEYRDERSGNVFTAQEIALPETQGAIYAFDFAYKVPQTLVPGSYTFLLRAFDGVNNASRTLALAATVTN